MTVCSTCKHANYCEIVAGGYSSQVKSCRDYRKGEMTNEEWFCGLSTEEKAEILVGIADMGEVPTVRKDNIKAIVGWLKQPHKEN